MTKQNIFPESSDPHSSPDIIDLLATIPSSIPFVERVKGLDLSARIETKVLQQEYNLSKGCSSPVKLATLSADDEKELATEVLIYRHQFTELLLSEQKFRQATLTVLQNIYLFRNRKIFFGNTADSAEYERQEALLLFSTSPRQNHLPLEKTFQHLIISRVWSRILNQSTERDLQNQPFNSLHDVVERLNTLRNVYMLLTTGLVKKLAAQTNALYKESVTYEDAVQIGGIGIARAAYRYHQSCGVRFSTFATNWVFREIQRQALGGRLVRISTNTVEGYTKAAKSGNIKLLSKFSAIIESATASQGDLQGEYAYLSQNELAAAGPSPFGTIEALQLRSILLRIIDLKLSRKCGDIIKRRYGLPPYQGEEQSILSISETFGVTRSSIYQLEQAALKKLQKHLSRELL